MAEQTMYVQKHFLPFFTPLSSRERASLAKLQPKRLREVGRPTVKKERSAISGFLEWCEVNGHSLRKPQERPRASRRNDPTASRRNDPNDLTGVDQRPQRPRQG